MIYLVTTNLADRARRLTAAEAEPITNALQWLRAAGRMRLFAFVVMPDHVHLLLQPHSGHLIHEVMKSWKARAAREINLIRAAAGGVWQRGFHDHAIRDDADFIRALNYVQENPVRQGLADRASAYPWCSAHPQWNTRLDVLP